MSDIVPRHANLADSLISQDMIVADTFLESYNREKAHYQSIAQIARAKCENALVSKVQGLFEHRAKTKESLGPKLHRRIKLERKRYADAVAIRKDIVDLAGVRIIMHSPHVDQWRAIHDMLHEEFHVQPGAPERDQVGLDATRDFSPGYSQPHYRVKFRDADKKFNPHNIEIYEDDIVEVQVRSVAFHTWASLSHSLSYKPSTGDGPSKEEEAIMRSVNGLVHSIEVLVAQVYESQKKRKLPFRSKWELGTFLESNLPPDVYEQERRERVPSGNKMLEERNLKSMRILKKFLDKAGLNTPANLKPILHELDFESINDAHTEMNENRRKINNEFTCEVKGKRETFKLKPSVYIIRYVLSERQNSGSAYRGSLKDEITEGSTCQQKCIALTSALIWVHKLFNEFELIQKLLDDKQDANFPVYRTFFYKSPLRPIIMGGETGDDLEEHYKTVDGFWDWFAKQDAPPLKLAFDIARLGVLEKLPDELSKLRVAAKKSDEPSFGEATLGAEASSNGKSSLW